MPVSVFSQYNMYSSTHLEHMWNTCTLYTVQYTVVFIQCTLCAFYCRYHVHPSVQSNLHYIQPNAHPMYIHIIYSAVSVYNMVVSIQCTLCTVWCASSRTVQCIVYSPIYTPVLFRSSAVWTIWRAGLVHIWDTCGHIWCSVGFTPSVQSKSKSTVHPSVCPVHRSVYMHRALCSPAYTSVHLVCSLGYTYTPAYSAIYDQSNPVYGVQCSVCPVYSAVYTTVHPVSLWLFSMSIKS